MFVPAGVPVTVMLIDNENNELVFDINFWHYRALVEAIRSLQVLPDEYVDRLHEPYTGAGLNKEECQLVAAELRSRLVPILGDDDRLLLDGATTKIPDDGVFHKTDADWHLNYSTNKRVLLDFVQALKDCNGFTVC